MSELNIRREGRAGRITLTRPKALNALTHSMCLKIESALESWAKDEAIALVIIDGEGDKAFCAGGDVIALYNEGRMGRDAGARQFWRDEYRLDLKIAGYPKPYVALMDGIVMGGGVGVSAHGSHRIVTERTSLAMPECRLGLIPDVGGTHLLARMPGYCGEYVGLTGARLDAADCLYSGFGDRLVPAEQLDALTKDLCETGDPARIDAFAVESTDSRLAGHQAEIDAVFGLSGLAAIRDVLAVATSDFGRTGAAAFERGAPFSLCATFELLRQARESASLSAALRHEFRFVSMALLEGEFVEGVRARLVDKDNTPRWKFDSLEAVPPDLIARLHQPARDGDLAI